LDIVREFPVENLGERKGGRGTIGGVPAEGGGKAGGEARSVGGTKGGTRTRCFERTSPRGAKPTTHQPLEVTPKHLHPRNLKSGTVCIKKASRSVGSRHRQKGDGTQHVYVETGISEGNGKPPEITSSLRKKEISPDLQIRVVGTGGVSRAVGRQGGPLLATPGPPGGVRSCIPFNKK